MKSKALNSNIFIGCFLGLLTLSLVYLIDKVDSIEAKMIGAFAATSFGVSTVTSFKRAREE